MSTTSDSRALVASILVSYNENLQTPELISAAIESLTSQPHQLIAELATALAAVCLSIMPDEPLTYLRILLADEDEEI